MHAWDHGVRASRRPQAPPCALAPQPSHTQARSPLRADNSGPPGARSRVRLTCAPLRPRPRPGCAGRSHRRLTQLPLPPARARPAAGAHARAECAARGRRRADERPWGHKSAGRCLCRHAAAIAHQGGVIPHVRRCAWHVARVHGVCAHVGGWVSFAAHAGGRRGALCCASGKVGECLWAQLRLGQERGALLCFWEGG